MHIVMTMLLVHFAISVLLLWLAAWLLRTGSRTLRKAVIQKMEGPVVAGLLGGGVLVAIGVSTGYWAIRRVMPFFNSASDQWLYFVVPAVYLLLRAVVKEWIPRREHQTQHEGQSRYGQDTQESSEGDDGQPPM